MNPIAEDILLHYGVKMRSGRYPWGSGKESFQRSGDFLSRVEELSKNGLSGTELAKAMGMTTTDLRLQMRVANHERRDLQAARAKSLRADGKSLNEITKEMGFKNDSSVRALLDENTAANKNKAKVTVDILKKELEKKGGMLDVGASVERVLGVSQNTLKEALFILQTEGYQVLPVGIPSVNNKGKQINTPILCNPDVNHKDIYADFGKIGSVGDYNSTDGGHSFHEKAYPQSIDSSRVYIKYGDKGGSAKDGVMEIRRGVADLNLGNSHYAQVRILVDGTHYLKGMAMYSDDIPEGTDIVFNTNKKSGTPKEKVFKEIDTSDKNNPFGAYIKANGQSTYTDKNGKVHLSAINKLKEEGDWSKMSENLSSQFLSKQPYPFIKKQLSLTYADHDAAFDEIKSLTNPTVKKKLLLDFAGSCDSAAVHLKAASLPRQKTQVLLPLPGISDKEIYAPNFKNGEQVALVRYPHGGTFEIPILTVNNKNSAGKKSLGPHVLDAVGIHPNVAERLSGADFDGDQVVVIPTNDKVRIKATPPLEGLINFNAKDSYPEREGMRYMTKANTGREMGMISNLITDMTLKGANEAEITKAVKHSMVVIDAQKHKLDYKKSEKDNDIKSLKEFYQGYTTESGKKVGGASTLLSRRKQTVEVDERQGSGRINKDTGKVEYNTSGREYESAKTGEMIKAKSKINLIESVDDVRSISSGTRQEEAYADYANKMKALANSARKEYLVTGNLKYNKEAKEKYKNEVDSLYSKLNIALMNPPKERQAQALANSVIKAKVQSNPELKEDKKMLRKISQQALNDARISLGTMSNKETSIKFTDKEWEAIQAGAITDTKLSQLLKYTDPDNVKSFALPKTVTTLSTAQVNKIKAMKNGGYTNDEIAKAMGKSISTISKYISQ